MMTISKIAPCQQMAFQGKVVNDPNAAIVERIQAGDADALQDLWSANKGLVAHFALHYLPLVERRSSVDIDDLTQAGYIGIHKAAEKFILGGTAKFSTYAVYSIKSEIRSALGITGKRDPADYALSLDAPINTDNDRNATLGDTIAADEQFYWSDVEEQREPVRAAVGRIKSNGIRSALVAYYWMGKSEKQIAEDYGAAPGLICQRILRGRSSLRKDTALLKWAANNNYPVWA